MEFRVLRYFLTVAKEESITGAAEALHVTQPTLSKQLMDLEAELGKKLFLRGNRKITLTEEGLFLRKRAQEIIELVEKTESDFNQSAENISGDVYIGSGESHAMGFIADLIQGIQKEHSRLRFHLHSGNAEDVTQRLDKGLLDFGILIQPTDVSKYDSMRLPAVDVWGVLMRKDSPLAAHDTIHPEDLWDLPLITSKQRFVSEEMSRWLKRDPDKLNIAATYNLIYNASFLVEAGIGYAITLDKLINTTGDSHLCFRPLEPRLEANLDIIWKKHQLQSKAAGKFLETLERKLQTPIEL